MKSKRLRNLIMFIFCIFPLFLSMGFSSWTIIKDEELTVKPSIATPVAFIDDEPNIKYTSLNKALEVAAQKESANVIVIPDNVIEVTETITIESNVKLYIPYSITYASNGNYSSCSYEVGKDGISALPTSTYGDGSSTSVKNNRKVLINLKDGADIIVRSGGELYLGGQCRRVGVVGLYTEINLSEGSMIDCYGSFYCYGYIKENSNDYKNASQTQYSSYYNNEYDVGRLIKVNSGAILKTQISFYDMKDAGGLISLDNANVFPLNQFDFPNLQTYTKMDYGSTLLAQTFLIATNSQANVTIYEELKVVSESSSMFCLKSGSTSFEYCPSNVLYTESTNGRTRIYIDGNLEQGSASLTVSGQTITTADKFMPLSYRLSVFVNKDASYTCGYKMKLLPGFLFKVNSGGTFNVNNEVFFYEGDFASKIEKYTNESDARLIINGTLKVSSAGKIAARIETECEDNSATLDFTSCETSLNFTVVSVEGEVSEEISKISDALFVDNSEEGKSYYQFVEGSKVYSDVNGGKCWDGEKSATRTITILKAETEFAHEIFAYEIYSADDTSGTNSQPVTSGVQSTVGSYSAKYGKYVQIIITRSTGVFNNDGNVVNSSTWYYVSGDMEVTITPKEGILLTVTTVADSGNKNTSFEVQESENQNGTFQHIITWKGITNESVYIVKDWWFKIIPTDCGTLEGTTRLDSDNYKITPAANGSTKFKASTAYQAIDEYTVHFPRKSLSECLLPDTLITMADGTYVPVKDIKPGDMLKVFNHETGLYDVAPVLFNDSEDEKIYNVINLEFSNGSYVGVVSEHGFFDLDEMKYVYIDEYNYNDYVGHRFYVDENTEATLSKAYVTQEYTKVYSPVTRYHMNYFTEDVLSMPGGVSGLFNIFEYDDNLQYNQEQMQKDIEMYGLFTYDDFKDLVPFELYDSFATPYFKVAIGKGILTWEQLYYYIERYGPLVE